MPASFRVMASRRASFSSSAGRGGWLCGQIVDASVAGSRASPRGFASLLTVASRFPPDGCFSPPAFGMSFLRSRACESGGREMFFTVPTATASRCATRFSAFSAGRLGQPAMRRSFVSGQRTSSSWPPAERLTEAEREGLAARSIAVVDGAVERVLARDDRLLGVQLKDGRIVEFDALFVPPRFVPNDALLVELGCDLDDNGWAVIDGTGRTSVPGVWVAGNVANARAQVITAAGEGSAAAIALNADLVADDVARALAAPEPASRRSRRTELQLTGGILMKRPLRTFNQRSQGPRADTSLR